eukprot:PhF_6_TR29079/c0_g1_i2/m.42388
MSEYESTKLRKELEALRHENIALRTQLHECLATAETAVESIANELKSVRIELDIHRRKESTGEEKALAAVVGTFAEYVRAEGNPDYVKDSVWANYIQNVDLRRLWVVSLQHVTNVIHTDGRLSVEYLVRTRESIRQDVLSVGYVLRNALAMFVDGKDTTRHAVRTLIHD